MKISNYFILAIMAMFIIVSCGKDDPVPPTIVLEEPDDTTDPVFIAANPDINDGVITFEETGPSFAVEDLQGETREAGNWGRFGGTDGLDLLVEYVDNPAVGDINGSARVVKVTEPAGVQSWSGFYFMLENNINFPSGQEAISVQFYSPAAGHNVLLKLEDGLANGAEGKKTTGDLFAVTTGTGWETLIFNIPEISGERSGIYNTITMILGYGVTNEAETSYHIDNFTFGTPVEVVVPDAPTGAPASPTLGESEVISIFSDAYTSVEGINFNPNWGQSTVVSTETIANNTVLKYETLNYQGTEITPAIDVTGKGVLHVDYFSGNATTLEIFLISPGPAETAVSLDVTSNPGEWNSADIQLSEFATVVDLSEVFQIKIVGNGTVYFDNIYFYGAGASEPSSAAPTPTIPEDEVTSIFSDAYTDVAGTDFNPNWGQNTVVTQPEVAGNTTLKLENLNYQGIALAAGIDVSDKTMLHFDYWTADSTGFNMFLISPGPSETAYAVPVSTGRWISVDVPLSNFSDVVDLTDVFQMKLDGNGTIYLDNIYFHSGENNSPASRAPVPTIPASEVISIFSSTYTDVEGTDFNPNWGQSTTVTQEEIGGANTLKYENLNYQGVGLASAIDVSGKTMLHLDYWTNDSTGFNTFLISSGPSEIAYAVPITTGQWVSIDIPLSEYNSVVDLTDLIQMKFDGNGTIYLDNIYFHSGAATSPSAAAPAPTAAEADVISIFSDAYTNVDGTDFNPNWGQNTVVTQEDIGGDTVLKYENLNYQGVAFASGIDVSGKTTLHLDYWTADSTALNAYLISPGPAETAHNVSLSNGQWVSLDIPLTDYSSVVNLADVIQMKFDGNGTIYLDNIYFH